MSNPKSLFIQVNTSNSSLLQTALEHIRQEHRDTNESDIIYNVVLTDILDGNGNPDPRLEIIRPYLPGGATPAFDNVFVGVGNTDYTGSNGTLPPWQATSPYAAGIKDPAFRWSNLIRQKDAWLKFSQWYGGSLFHGYVGYEAVLSWWTNNSIAQAYEAYLIQSVIDLHSVAPGSAVLWSPSIWDRWTWLSAEQKTLIVNAINNVFTNIPAWAYGNKVNWLHIQDARGTTAGWGTAAVQNVDVQAWYQDIGALNLWDSFRVNMEMFNQYYMAITPATYDLREQEYSNLQVGASWELRYWWPSHTEVDDLAYHGSATTQKADNISWANRNEVRTYLYTGQLTGQYANRAHVADIIADEIRIRFGLAVQGDRYMRPYDPNPPAGRATNSDHLTAGALDIFFQSSNSKEQLAAVRAYLDDLKAKNVVRYYIDLGANDAHNDHIHASLQLGVY